ncbi:deoxycytidylate deaminase [Aureibacillus halotolerans]
MTAAERNAKYSTCKKLQVGCVLIKSDGYFVGGWNSATGCESVKGCEVEGHCRSTLHAEMDALITCARLGQSTYDATLYVTHYPCPDCLKHLRAAGVRKIYYKHEYPHAYSNNFADGMEIIKYEESVLR